MAEREIGEAKSGGRIGGDRRIAHQRTIHQCMGRAARADSFSAQWRAGAEEVIDRPVPAVWNLGAVAFFRPRKGLEVLLESISLLRRQGLPVQLRVIGGFDSPAYQNEVRQLAEKLGIAQFVEWRGFCQDVDAELDTLDLLVLPSILPEGMPMVLLEALAAGVPPMGSRVDGITDVIEHGRNGLLFEPGSAEAIAESVSMVIGGQHDWRQLRRNAIRSHAEQYSDRGMARGVADIYRKVLEIDGHD